MLTPLHLLHLTPFFYGLDGQRIVGYDNERGKGDHRHIEGKQERYLTFPDMPAMLNALSPKRLELLRAVHHEPSRSGKALAERLGRDYKRVHEDVETLAATGLLLREKTGLSAPYDAIAAEMRL